MSAEEKDPLENDSTLTMPDIPRPEGLGAQADEEGTDPAATAFDPSSDPGLGEGGAAPPERPEEPPPVEAGERLPSIIESLLLAADRPMTAADFGGLVGERDLGKVTEALGGLQVHYQQGRGIQLHEVAGGWQLRTAPENSAWVQKLLATKPVRLTRSQLETLAIVGYRQPITRPEIDEIRGVDSGGTLKTLLDRSLVRILGKKEEPGRPLLYGTTKEFLEFFNLRDLRDLPTLREFHELSEEHQAQVAALEEAAPEGAIVADPPAPALERVDLPEDRVDQDLGEIDSLIDSAGARAQAAAAAIAADQKPDEPEGEPAA
jgi:segregation and condensation protein B